MSDSRRERVRGLFDAMEELRQELDLEERREWLVARCDGDHGLVEEVWSLHEAASNVDSGFLNPPKVLTQPEDLLGMELHEYRLHSVLGVGGMGAVYRAFGKHGNREVAIKVLHPSFSGDRDSRRRFELEVELVGKLKHSNIVRLLTAGEKAGLLWFAMDLVNGWSLANLQKLQREGEALPPGAPDIKNPKIIARITHDLANALTCAHDAGVLHRDIKPGNFLIDRDGNTHLADFGLARVLEADPVTLTGMVGGTCSYMSPEQARQLKDAVTAHSDIYSAGAVLYELLSGAPPFGLDSSPAVLRHIAEEEVPSLLKNKRNVNRGLALCAQKALRLAPEERYSSAQDLAEDMSRWLAGKSVLARAPGWKARLRSRARSRRFVAYCAASLVGITMLLSGLAMWRNSHANARKDWGKITLDGSKLPTGTRIGVDVLGFEQDKRLLSEPLSGVGSGEWDLGTPSGVVWVHAQFPGLPEQEIVRIVLPKEEVLIAPQPAHALPSTVSFIAVAAGSCRIVSHREDQSDLIEDKQVEAFQISQYPITNKEFEQFLSKSGRTRGESLEKARERLMPSSSVDGWGQLPATGITFEMAQAASEWWGCRLPTRAEWELAVLNHVPLGPADEGPGILVGLHDMLPDADGNESTYLAYVAYAGMGKAVGTAAASEMVLANVSEWTVSPLFIWTQGTPSMIPGMVMLCGANWHSRAAAIDFDCLTTSSSTFVTMSSGDVGFRLVR